MAHLSQDSRYKGGSPDGDTAGMVPQDVCRNAVKHLTLGGSWRNQALIAVSMAERPWPH